MAWKSDKQKKFVEALEHNSNFAQKVKANTPAKMSNLGSFNQMRMPKFNQPAETQQEAMNPSVKFKKLRSKLKY